MADLPEFLRYQDITPGILRGMRRRRDVVQRRLLDFVEVETNDTDDGKIRREVRVQEVEAHSQVRGYLEPSVAVRDARIEEQRIEPFHISEHVPHDVDDKGVERAGENDEAYEISRERLRDDIDILEPRRRELYTFALASALDNEQFTFDNGEDKRITVPYSNYMLDLGASTNTIGGGSFDTYQNINDVKQGFAQENDIPPNMALISGQTRANMLDNNEIANAMKPVQPMDMPETQVAFDAFMWEGIMWNVLYRPVKDSMGNGQKPISDNKWILFNNEQGAPFTFQKVNNTRNGGDASEPFYETIVESRNPLHAITQVYDNVVPDFREKNAVAKYDVS